MIVFRRNLDGDRSGIRIELAVGDDVFKTVLAVEIVVGFIPYLRVTVNDGCGAVARLCHTFDAEIIFIRIVVVIQNVDRHTCVLRGACLIVDSRGRAIFDFRSGWLGNPQKRVDIDVGEDLGGIAYRPFNHHRIHFVSIAQAKFDAQAVLSAPTASGLATDFSHLPEIFTGDLSFYPDFSSQGRQVGDPALAGNVQPITVIRPLLFII